MTMNSDRIDTILNFWFGESLMTSLPTVEQTNLWFGYDDELVQHMREEFYEDWEKATSNAYTDWEKEPRGRLALILLLDQFTRKFFRDTPQSYEQDGRAQELCIDGIRLEQDREIDLIERVYFYMPLLHSEHFEMQRQSVQAYQSLVDLSMHEVLDIYQGFLDYSRQRCDLITKFGRFPQRNEILGRKSTPEELELLKKFKQN